MLWVVMVFADATETKKRPVRGGMLVKENDVSFAILLKLKSAKHRIILQRLVRPRVKEVKPRCVQIIVRQVKAGFKRHCGEAWDLNSCACTCGQKKSSLLTDGNDSPQGVPSNKKQINVREGRRP